AIAQAILERRWQAILVDISQNHLDQARDQLAAQRSLCHFQQLDVTDEQAVQELIARCDAEMGPLTGLVNSAGVAANVHCLDTSAALFRKLLEVNLIGSFLTAREAARHMSQRGRGSIVNLASVSGVRGNSG